MIRMQCGEWGSPGVLDSSPCPAVVCCAGGEKKAVLLWVTNHDPIFMEPRSQTSLGDGGPLEYKKHFHRIQSVTFWRQVKDDP